MDVNTTLMTAFSEADQVAASHLEFILSSGEKGESATTCLAVFERMVKDDQDKLSTLQAELIVLAV